MNAPVWLIVATAAMAVLLLGMAVAETSLQGHYLIDQGEYLSLVGLVFILIAGVHLHRRGRLAASLPLMVPWLLYPVITQGDQIIDNLSIGWMRLIVHVLLAAIFATPVAVVVLAARAMSPALRDPWSASILAAALFAAEMWLAYRFLGWLMIVTLVLLIAASLAIGYRRRGGTANPAWRLAPTAALVVLIFGVGTSFALYLAFKNRPGAYQGSPSFYMDPSQQAAEYPMDRIAVPAGPVSPPPAADTARRALSGYAASLQKLLEGYYVLDRNYNHHFHNELFMRDTALVPGYRAVGLRTIDAARALRDQADREAEAARALLSDDNPLAALLDEMRAYTAYSFQRAATLERMSAEFERTRAGLQHATHLYEGEGKFLGVRLAQLLDKHRRVIEAPSLLPVTAEFTMTSRAIHGAYANRIVGF